MSKVWIQRNAASRNDVDDKAEEGGGEHASKSIWAAVSFNPLFFSRSADEGSIVFYGFELDELDEVDEVV